MGPTRTKTRYPGIYRVGNKYHIRYWAKGKQWELSIDGNLEYAHEIREDRRKKGKKGKHDIIRMQEKMTFGELFKLYAEGEGKAYVLKFKEAYLKYFDDLKLSQITRQDLFKFRDQLKDTPKQRGKKEITNSSVNRALAGLRRLFSWAVARDLMEESSNPFPLSSKSGLFYPEPKGLRNYFTEKQIDDIIENAPGWMKPLITISYYTGMRLGELTRLKWEHLDLDRGIIYLPNSKTLKDTTGKGQRIVMQTDLIEVFRGLPHRDDEYVFVRAYDGLPYEDWNIDKPFKQILERLGIKGSWRDIRHTTASHLHLKGIDLVTIKDQLRHRSSKTTESFYIGTDVEHQREEIEKLTLNKPKAEA